MAAAIARDRYYEIDCVQVMLIPRHSSPSETQVRNRRLRVVVLGASREGLLQQAIQGNIPEAIASGVACFNF